LEYFGLENCALKLGEDPLSESGDCEVFRQFGARVDTRFRFAQTTFQTQSQQILTTIPAPHSPISLNFSVFEGGSGTSSSRCTGTISKVILSDACFRIDTVLYGKTTLPPFCISCK
jgi:hypothetical protein